MRKLRRGIAVPCFGDDPAGCADLGVAVEEAGFDGYFLWDHMVWSDTGDGPPILDPWLVLAVVAARTSRIRIGTVVTPVPRRRPWQLARETTTLDRLSGGRAGPRGGVRGRRRGGPREFGGATHWPRPGGPHHRG